MTERGDDALEAAKRASTLQLLFRAARLVEESSRARIAERPGRPRLRRSHMLLFPHLSEEGVRITTLAERLGVSKQAVSQSVDDLEALGMVDRVADEQDARAKRVRLTPLGRRGMLDGLRELGRFEAELRAEVGASRMDELRRGLEALLVAVDRDAPREP